MSPSPWPLPWLRRVIAVVIFTSGFFFFFSVLFENNLKSLMWTQSSPKVGKWDLYELFFQTQCEAKKNITSRSKKFPQNFCLSRCSLAKMFTHHSWTNWQASWADILTKTYFMRWTLFNKWRPLRVVRSKKDLTTSRQQNFVDLARSSLPTIAVSNQCIF